jgi:uncharacterized protein DUF5715
VRHVVPQEKQMKRVIPLVAAVVAAYPAHSAAAADLGGSRASMKRQHGVAVSLDYTFSRTASQVRSLVDEGRLERVTDDADFALSDVSYPYARPEVKLFIARLAAQYHAATGERMVVTSLVRPTSEQPRNASPLSVHPAGMAVDLRVPTTAATRAWLEKTLLSLESAGVLDVTREVHPSHFHVALFPDAYRAYVAEHGAAEAASATAPVVLTPAEAPAPPAAATVASAPAAHSSHAAIATLLVLLSVGLAATARYRTADAA